MSSYPNPSSPTAQDGIKKAGGDWDPVELQKQLDAIEAIGPQLMADVMKLRTEHCEIAGGLETSLQTIQHDAQLAQQREAALEAQLAAARKDARIAAERLNAATIESERLLEVDARYQAIQRDITTARGELQSAQEMSAVLAAAGAEAARIHNELEEVTADRDRLHQIAASSAASAGREIERYIAKSNKLEKNNRQLTTLLEEAKSSHDAAIAQAESEREQLVLQNNDVQQTVKRLRDQVAEQIESRNSFEHEMLRLRIERDEWRARSAEVQARLEDSQTKANGARQNLETANASLRTENQQLRDQLQAAQQQAAKQAETDAIVAELNAAQEVIEGELKRTRRSFEQAALVHAETYTIMQAEARELTSTIADLQLKNDRLRSESDTRRQQYEQANATLTEVEDKLRSDNARTMSIVDQLEARLKQQKEEDDSQKQTIEEELAEARIAIENANRYIEQLTAENERLGAVDDEVSEIKAELIHAIAQRDNLKDELQIVQRQMLDAKEETRTVEKRLREKMDAFLEEAKTVCARARQMQDQAQAEAAQLRQENRMLRSDGQSGSQADGEPAGASSDKSAEGLRLDGEQHGRPSGLFSGIKRKSSNEPRPAWPQ